MLIIDSGVGGLSIAKEIRQHCPDISINYLMDDGFFPYGTKDDAQLRLRLQRLCREITKVLSPKLIVIACNTASTLALNELRAEFNIPFVGVVPAIKVAAQQSKTGEIGLLATPATVKRTYIDNLIHDFASHCEVRRLGSDKLVVWAEEYLQGKAPKGLYEHLNHWLTEPTSPSHVVLGCTHFPFLKPLLAQYWPQIQWVDSGQAIARRVASLSEHMQPDSKPECRLFWTKKQTPHSSVPQFLDTLFPLKESRQLNL